MDASMAERQTGAWSGARHGLVLSGGGARGAYEVGVLKALFAGVSPATGGRALRVEIFTGTSVGAYNAAFLAQEDNAGAATVARLEDLWRRRIAETPQSCGNGVYWLRADPLRWLDPGCLRQPLTLLGAAGRDAVFWSGYALAYGAQLLSAPGPLRLRALETVNLAALFSPQPLDELLADTIDLDRLRASASTLAVVASDWINGKVKVFRKPDITERLGTDAILASAAIPGVFPPVEVDGAACVDGALLMNTPLKPAIRDGAEVLHVIYLDPQVSSLPFPPLPNTLDTLGRLYTILLAAQLNGDLRTAATVNEEMAVLGHGRRAELPVARARRQAAGPPYRPLEIHRYRPQTGLGGIEGLLDFRLAHIDNLIARGYEDALHHDCRASACILPPASMKEARFR
jgi:NTE family protein